VRAVVQEKPGGRRGDRGGEVGGVAIFLHRRDDDGAGAGQISGGQTDHAAEEHAGHDVDVGQPAAHPAHHGAGELKQPRRDAAGVHQPARENEQWQRRQHGAVHAGHHGLGKRERPGAGEVEFDHHRGADGDGDKRYRRLLSCISGLSTTRGIHHRW